jgi:hypothetical protein
MDPLDIQHREEMHPHQRSRYRFPGYDLWNDLGIEVAV